MKTFYTIPDTDLLELNNSQKGLLGEMKIGLIPYLLLIFQCEILPKRGSFEKGEFSRFEFPTCRSQI
jgi:hypothetical protein